MGSLRQVSIRLFSLLQGLKTSETLEVLDRDGGALSPDAKAGGSWSGSVGEEGASVWRNWVHGGHRGGSDLGLHVGGWEGSGRVGVIRGVGTGVSYRVGWADQRDESDWTGSGVGGVEALDLIEIGQRLRSQLTSVVVGKTHVEQGEEPEPSSDRVHGDLGSGSSVVEDAILLVDRVTEAFDGIHDVSIDHPADARVGPNDLNGVKFVDGVVSGAFEDRDGVGESPVVVLRGLEERKTLVEGVTLVVGEEEVGDHQGGGVERVERGSTEANVFLRVANVAGEGVGIESVGSQNSGARSGSDVAEDLLSSQLGFNHGLVSGANGNIDVVVSEPLDVVEPGGVGLREAADGGRNRRVSGSHQDSGSVGVGGHHSVVVSLSVEVEKGEIGRRKHSPWKLFVKVHRLSEGRSGDRNVARRGIPLVVARGELTFGVAWDSRKVRHCDRLLEGVNEFLGFSEWEGSRCSVAGLLSISRNNSSFPPVFVSFWISLPTRLLARIKTPGNLEPNPRNSICGLWSSD